MCAQREPTRKTHPVYHPIFSAGSLLPRISTVELLINVEWDTLDTHPTKGPCSITPKPVYKKNATLLIGKIIASLGLPVDHTEHFSRFLSTALNRWNVFGNPFPSVRKNSFVTETMPSLAMGHDHNGSVSVQFFLRRHNRGMAPAALQVARGSQNNCSRHCWRSRPCCDGDYAIPTTNRPSFAHHTFHRG